MLRITKYYPIPTSEVLRNVTAATAIKKITMQHKQYRQLLQ